MRPVAILLLEDSSLDADLTLARLSRGGLSFTVRRVETRAQFQAALDEGCFDLILADYHLPDFDGLTALHLAREHCPDIPFIFVSGLLGEEVAIDSLQRGATDYVLKRRLERLVPAVQRALAEAAGRRERRRMQEEFDRFFSLSLDLFGIVSSDGYWKRVNPSFVRTLGYTAEQLTHLSFAALVHSDDSAILSAEQQKWNGGESSPNFEVRMRCQDGEYKWIAWSVVAYPAERLLYCGGRDVTTQKQAEEVLAVQAQELARSNADLQQFAYVTSHDLQEPLRSIASYAQLLSRRYSSRLDEDADEFLGFIVDGVHRMKSLIDGLLVYARIANVREIPHAPAPMEGILQWALMNLEMLIEGSHATVTHDELPVVEGDQIQLVQLLQNLIGNAIKYRGPEPPRIHVSASRQDGEWVFRVKDNGIGMNEEYLERIFGIFKRLHGKDVPGTGIGLAICRKIVEQHGGRIWAESQPGQGSTFVFTLPAPVADETELPGRQPASAVGLR